MLYDYLLRIQISCVDDTCFVLGRSPVHVWALTTTQDILNISTQLFNFLILIVDIEHDDWILDDMFINKHILDECTYR